VWCGELGRSARTSLGAPAGRGVRGLGLSVWDLWLLTLAAATIAGSAAAAPGVGEDVIQHNGSATTDPPLRFFVQHRPHWLISAAKDVTSVGAAPMLGL